jgi:hypothetical protein
MADTTQGRGHPQCYAQTLRECRGDVNREHYVSAAVLKEIGGGPSVLVNNLAHQQSGVAEERGIKGLVGKILCEGHNGRLNEFDTAGATLYRGMNRLNDGVRWVGPPFNVVRVDGDALERWMLKTLCGGLFVGAFPMPPGINLRNVCPPREWLEILFKGAAFPDRQGLYLRTGAEDEVITADEKTLKIQGLFSEDMTQIGGLQVWLFGFQFLLLAATNKPGVPTEFDSLPFRPAGFVAVGSDTRIQFDWKDGPGCDDVYVRHVASGPLGVRS